MYIIYRCFLLIEIWLTKGLANHVEVRFLVYINTKPKIGIGFFLSGTVRLKELYPSLS